MVKRLLVVSALWVASASCDGGGETAAPLVLPEISFAEAKSKLSLPTSSFSEKSKGKSVGVVAGRVLTIEGDPVAIASLDDDAFKKLGSEYVAKWVGLVRKSQSTASILLITSCTTSRSRSAALLLLGPA